MCIFELRANKVEFDVIRTDYHFTRCDTDPSGSLETVPEDFYAKNWTLNKKASQEYGKEWLKSRRSLFLAVRSAPLPTETNYIVNPSHPDFAGLTFSRPAAVPLDLRIA